MRQAIFGKYLSQISENSFNMFTGLQFFIFIIFAGVTVTHSEYWHSSEPLCSIWFSCLVKFFRLMVLFIVPVCASGNLNNSALKTVFLIFVLLSCYKYLATVTVFLLNRNQYIASVTAFLLSHHSDGVPCWVRMTPLTGPILDSEGMGAVFWVHFLKKRTFCLLAPPKQMSFLTISNKNISFKTKGTRLGATVAPNKCLEWALPWVLCVTECLLNNSPIISSLWLQLLLSWR